MKTTIVLFNFHPKIHSSIWNIIVFIIMINLPLSKIMYQAQYFLLR